MREPSKTKTKTAEAAEIVARRIGCAGDVAAEVVEHLFARAPRPVETPVGYVNGTSDDDLAAIADDLVATEAETDWRAEYHARKRAAPMCEHGFPDFIHPRDGNPDCPLCRLRAQATNEHSTVESLSDRGVQHDRV